MSEEPSIGPRVNALEMKVAVHEAECALRYEAITTGISAMRVEMTERAARHENLVKAVTAMLAMLLALLEIARRFWGL
jgi:hypothetical protein